MLLRRRCASSRRGMIIPLVAVCLIIMIGMLAMAVDVGWMVNTKDQLQNAADSGALAAAMELSLSQPTRRSSPDLGRVAAVAKEYVNYHRAGEKMADIDTAVDVEFGFAQDNDDGTTSFVPSGSSSPGAVRVTVRRQIGSPAGELPLYFAGVLGRTYAEINARAAAMKTTGDFAFVVDLSGTMMQDTSLYHLFPHPGIGTGTEQPGVTINSFDAWVALSTDDFPSFESPFHIQRRTEAVLGQYLPYVTPQSEAQSRYSGMKGPTWGFIGNQLPYGSWPIVGSYNPETDPGLVCIPPGSFRFRQPDTRVATINSSTLNRHAGPGNQVPNDSTYYANGDLIGVLGTPGTPAGANFAGANSGLANIVTALTNLGYSTEELYKLRMPEDTSALVPRNPAIPLSSGAALTAGPGNSGFVAESAGSEAAMMERWRTRAMILLGLSTWNSNYMNPDYLMPPATPPNINNNAINQMLRDSSTATALMTQADWTSQINSGDYSLTVGRQGEPSGTGYGGTITMANGKRFVAGASFDPAFYQRSGPDGLLGTNDDDTTVASNSTIFKGAPGTNLTNGYGPEYVATGGPGWRGPDGTFFSTDDVIPGLALVTYKKVPGNQQFTQVEKRWILPGNNSKYNNPSGQTNGQVTSASWITQPRTVRRYHYWNRAGSSTLPGSIVQGDGLIDNGELLSTTSMTEKVTKQIVLTLDDMFDWVADPKFLRTGEPGDNQNRNFLITTDPTVPPLEGTYPNQYDGGTYAHRARLIQWRFGVKTFVEKMMLQEAYQWNERLVQAPLQPHQKSRDIIWYIATQYLGTTSTAQANLTAFALDGGPQSDVIPLSANDPAGLWSLDYMHNNSPAFGGPDTPIMGTMPGHWNGGTNIAAGFRRAWYEMDPTRGSTAARQSAKQILILISDCRPNVDCKFTGEYGTQGDNTEYVTEGKAQALAQAQYLRTRNVQLNVLVVGADGDLPFGEELAATANGIAVRKTTDIDPTYDVDVERVLEHIHRSLGARLIE